MNTSWCSGYIAPKQSLDDLVAALKQCGMRVGDPWEYIYHEQGTTGFTVDRKENAIVSEDGTTKAGGFTAFVEALIKVSDHIARAYVSREGPDHEDYECYTYDGTQWRQAICPTFMVPIGEKAIEEAWHSVRLLGQSLYNLHGEDNDEAKTASPQ